MKNKKIIEGNRLITQFMDWELIQTKDKLKAWVFRNKKTKEVILLDDTDPYNRKMWNKDSVIEFRKSWDVLIPAINKAYAVIDEVRKRDGIGHRTASITMFNALNTFLCDSYDKKGNKKGKYDIEQAWNHLIDFIKCYDRYNYEQEILKKARSKK